MDLQSAISSYITSYSPWPDPFGYVQRKLLELGYLPIYPDWSGWLGLNPDLDFQFYSEHEDTFMPFGDEWRLFSIVYAADSYRELRALIPERSPEALDCPLCSQSRIHSLMPNKHKSFGCVRCSGLGWVLLDDSKPQLIHLSERERPDGLG